MDPELFDALISAAMESNKKFAELLKSVMRKKGITVKELSAGSGVPVSTINKILSEDRDLRLSTLRDVIRYVVTQHGVAEGDITVGIIAARSSLNAFSKNVMILKGKKVLIKEYPVNSLEDAIISAIKAERERVQGLVCASIVATTIEKFVRIPLVTIRIEESNIIDSLETLVEKILSSTE
ncbi:MAG: helix-turn-helix domain-containing protein [Candidatus Verstraetearchaeota archaeon]|nr:helix-turn-helix domain-containing protein [Candidatus Verstraetearchaeota archaeon]